MAISRALRDVSRGEKGMVPKKGHTPSQDKPVQRSASAPRLKEETKANSRREISNPAR
jgi:hypothetical protein